MDQKGLQLLSETTVYSKYARYLSQYNRRETWDEIVDRNVEMHLKKFPQLKKEIEDVFNTYVRNKLVLPSGRSLQFAGKAIEIAPMRIMNCSAMPIDDVKSFREAMFLLLCGCGVGFSVQWNHIKKLPKIKKPTGKRRYLIQDSIIGWSDAVHALMMAYFGGNDLPLFDYRDIRPRGELLKTSGGRAPGPDGLRESLEKIEKILEDTQYGEHLRPIQVYDICCWIAGAVLSGGIRRSACICLFDFDDQEMINAKSSEWYKENPQRAYSNNSAMTLRYKVRKKDFMKYMKMIEQNRSGDPGIYFSNDYNCLTNPCFHKDTLIRTSEGPQKIRDLVGKTVKISDGNQWVEIDNFRITARNQKILNIKLNDYSVIRATPYHTFILENGKKIQAKNLEINQPLKTLSPFQKRVIEITEQKELEDEVYCCTVPTNHQIELACGVITGQCGEVQSYLNFCNLTTFNMAKVESNNDLNEFVKAASFIGTLQAAYTNFHYLRPVWQERTEAEALLGASMTGLSRKDLTDFDLVSAAEEVLNTNEKYAKTIGINKAYRATANKPEGTSSAVLMTSSGVHAWFSEYACRRVRYPYDDPMLVYLENKMPELVEQDQRDPKLKIFTYPIKAPDNVAIRGKETSIDILERVYYMYNNWVKPGHRKGNNGHSVSATIEVKDHEWGEVSEWMWKNKNNYNGLSVYPFDDSTHVQMPFEAITKEKFEEMSSKISDVDLSEVREYSDNTTRQQELACAGGACEIK